MYLHGGIGTWQCNDMVNELIIYILTSFLFTPHISCVESNFTNFDKFYIKKISTSTISNIHNMLFSVSLIKLETLQTKVICRLKEPEGRGKYYFLRPIM